MSTLRRLLALLLPALFLAAAAPAAGQVDPTDREALRRGLIYEGLQRTSRADPCRGAYRLVRTSQSGFPSCTHGPDPAPPGVDVRADRPAELAADTGAGAATAAATAAAAQVPCFGNGSDGYRVQLLYVRASDKADNYASRLSSFQQWAARIDDVFNTSAAETGGTAHVRFVHDASCVPVVGKVVLSSRGDDNIDATISELRSKGYNRSDRRYLVWMEANVYCAIAEIWPDDQPGQSNSNNGVASLPGSIGRVDKGCWGNTNLAEVHELVHTMGGVQPTAPNGTPGFHCRDEYDRLCYSDGTASARVVCGSSSHEALLDCNHNDYFSTNPPSGSYLATHWNVARSVFLATSGAPPPTTTTTRPATTSTTTTTTTAPTSTTTSTTTTTATTTSTTVPPAGSLPSAPQALSSSQPATGTGVALMWGKPASPGNPAYTTLRLYRGTTWGSLTPLVDLRSSATTYNDTATTAGVVYWYVVKAVNTVGESPPSNLTRMAAK